MRMLGRIACPAMFAVLLCVNQVSWAQRTNDNALESASDAFGTTVGNESIGLYSPSDVRGFNPIQAGNVRIEGLYFDRQSDLSSLLIAGSAVHVGISAQSYAFPGPTGIVDYSLRVPGDKLSVSTVITAGPFDTLSGEVDAQIPITDKLSVGGGIIGMQTRQFFGGLNLTNGQAVLAHWEPIPEVELTPFWGREHVDVLRGAPYPIMGCSCLPPEVDPQTFYGQPWGNFLFNHTNYGLIARAMLPGGYRVQAGVFRSIEDKPVQNYNLYLNTNPQGIGDNYMVRFPHSSFKSISGEVRFDKNFVIGQTNNIFDLTFRARQVDRKFGGTDTKYLGTYAIGVYHPVPKPVFNLGPSSYSRATQETVGVNYQVEWKDVGQASVGVQKMFYSRKLDDPVRPDTTTSTQPWIMNASFAVSIGPAFALYGSYTEGLEEADEAPSNATNRGEAVPSIRTSQIDGGIRYKVTPSVSLIAGVFQVKKPYYSLDRTSTFAQLGEVRHRGVEVSLSGQVLPSLTVIAGAVFLQARINPAAGVTLPNTEPLGRYPRIVRLNAEYRLPNVPGLSVDGQVEALASRIGSADGVAKIPARYSGNLGMRYRFKIMGTPMSFRGQVLNITDVFGWYVSPTGLFDTSFTSRRFIGTLAADF